MLATAHVPVLNKANLAEGMMQDAKTTGQRGPRKHCPAILVSGWKTQRSEPAGARSAHDDARRHGAELLDHVRAHDLVREALTVLHDGCLERSRNLTVIRFMHDT